MWVKVCGVRTVEQARHAEACGANAIGVNLHGPSPRSVSPEVAAEIAASVDIEVVLVVVDRTLDDLEALVESIGPGSIQLHGHEPPGFGAGLEVPVWKAFRAHAGVEEEIEAWGDEANRFLLDAHVPGLAGGTGRRVDENLARRCADLGSMVLAGGLNPDNVADIAGRVGPWGVDVASGVESAPGAQDPDRVRAFIAAVRCATG